MKAERWKQINDLFQSATECPPEERAAFLDQASHGDKGLRREVESLLTSYERAENFIESPAFEVAPELLTNDKAGALVGELIGYYRIESLIGIGGMGEVYLARDERLGRKVALKLLPERLTADKTQLSRFKTEARTASALNHPNILTVYEIGAEGNRQFIATEFIEGITLRASLARGRMNLRDALEIAVQVASALAAAHETGVVHRDIKPENIMLRPDGYAKVLDFGIAKLTEQHPGSDSHEIGTTTLQTQPGLVLGTARYMSPEQTRGQKADARSDIWSLGVVLYEMVGGVPPFSGETPSDCIASILTREPPPLSGVSPNVPLKLQSIVQKALRKNRDERYQTIKEMLTDLRNLKGELEAEGSSPQIKARAEPILSKIKRHKRAALVALAAAIVAAAALAYHFYFPAPAPSPNEKSIAVLPFADLSQARDQEYFCDGIQEEILTRLSKIRDLKVISRTSTQRFKSAPKNLPEIAKQLGVANILEGTVQKAEGQVRVNVQLINARSDSHLWAEKYDRKLTDVFGVESEIAKAIADTLQAKLSGFEQRAIATRPTENAEAHQLYLKGTFFFNKRTGPDLRTAIDYFKEAIGKDPNYALAYAGLADAYALLSRFGGEGPQETVPQAKAAARKALELEDTLPEAHNSLGLVLALYDFDFAQSKKEFERAIELNPNYATAHHQFGNMNLTMVGEFDRAIAEGKRALELDPLSLIINTDLGQNFLLARRYDEAIDQLRKTLAMEPRFYYARSALGEALQMKGQLREAITEYEKVAEITDDPMVMAILAQGYAKTGQRDKARDLFSQLEQLATHRHVGPVIFALAHLALGENEKAIDYLERAYLERPDPYIVAIKVQPLLDPLRGHPRFERLVATVLGTAENNSPAQTIESKSIAVLPFENLSSEPDNVYLADGIQEEILTRLAKIRDLKVISRTSTQRFKSTPANLPEIAKQLGVANILEGTVQKAEGQVRVNVQLINARNDSHLWADKYDRKLTDIFAVESEIAEKIADTLQAKLSSAEQKVLNARPTEITEAHQLYLRGRYVMEKRTPADLNKAAEYFNQAIARDPNYAAAYAGLADCYVLLPQWKQGPVAEYLSKARAAANKALQIDDNLAEAHVSLGMIAFGEKLDLREARREFERAIQLNPNYALAHYCLGYSVLLALGNHDQAIAELKRAIELDPVSSVINTNLGYAYVLARRYPEAIAQLRKTIELDPSFAYAHAILGEALELNGQLNDALTEYEKSYVVGHDYRGLMMMARVHGLKGDRARALQLFEQAKQLSSPDIWAFGCAMVYVGLGDRNETLNWLEQSYRQKEFINLSTIKEDPLFDSLRGDPRFEKLANEIVPLGVIPARTMSIPEKSIAVLPFADLSQARDQEYFCDGIQEEILTRLSKIRDLKVISRTSTQRFKSAPGNLPEIARQLGVANILEGTVQKADNQVRVHVQLISARNDSHLWGEKYDRKLTDVFGVESEIAKAIADTLQAKLSGSEQRAIAAQPTQNIEAYDLYLRGLYFSNKSGEEDLRKALSLFQRALDKDPTFARAWTGIAKVWLWLADAYVKPLDAWPAVKGAALKAIALDEQDGEAYAYLAEAKRLLDWDFAGANAELKRALRLDPNFGFGHLLLAHFHAMQGQLEEALRQAMEAKQLDPLSPGISNDVTGIYLDTGRLDEALAEAQRTLMLDPSYLYPGLAYGVAAVYREKGMFDKAIVLYSKEQEATQLPSSGLAVTYARMGRQAEARRILDQLVEKARTQYIAADSIAAVYVALGEKDEAFRWLERAYVEHAWGTPNIAVSREFRPLRSDPRYADLLRRTGLDPSQVLPRQNKK